MDSRKGKEFFLISDWIPVDFNSNSHSHQSLGFAIPHSMLHAMIWMGIRYVRHLSWLFLLQIPFALDPVLVVLYFTQFVFIIIRL